MDSMTAFFMGQAAQGNESMVFDWDKAAEIIRESKLVGFTAGDLGAISRIFERMRLAEEEINKGKERWPKNEIVIDGLFLLCRPTPLLQELADVMYRGHCRELVKRVGEMTITGKVKKIDLSLGTDAELCGIFSDASFRNPLGQLHTRIYVDAFTRITGHDIYKGTGIEVPDVRQYEEWPDQARDEEMLIRARIAQDWRVLHRVEATLLEPERWVIHYD